MRALLALFVVSVLTLGATAAVAGGHEEVPLHPHALILGLELSPEDEPIGARKCVDLAGNRAVPLNAHHATVHTGTAGEALFDKAGHVVVPLAPLTPWANCAELLAAFGL